MQGKCGILKVMNEENRKIIMTHLIIGIATALIIIGSTIATLAFIIGRADESFRNITSETQKWDNEVIALNEKILLLQHGK